METIEDLDVELGYCTLHSQTLEGIECYECGEDE